MIRVKIDTNHIPNWAYFGEDAYKCYLIIQLKKAGVPTIGNLLSQDIDYSKGRLTKLYNPMTLEDIYTWEELNEIDNLW